MFNPETLLLTRRKLLQFSGGMGLNLGGFLRAYGSGVIQTTSSPIKACILVFYYGGPSHIDTYDMKPDGPAEIRGEFKPIATSVPGLHISEHLPRMARLMHKTALVRSVTHQARLHDSASIHALTGRPLEGPDRELFAPQPQTFPSYGGAIAYLNRNKPAETPFATVPYAFQNVHPVPCQGGGFLGAAYDPLLIDVDVKNHKYNVEMLKLAEGLEPARSLGRQSLLDSIEVQNRENERLKLLYHKAHKLLNSEKLKVALDISRESQASRDRYGYGQAPLSVGEGGGGGNGAELAPHREMRGQNMLMARRLVEAGVPFVNVHDFKQQGQNWDAHFKCFNQHKTHLLPMADQGLSALIEDLDARGMLDSTLVVAMGEFGRTPKINGDGGRDHWPDCYTVLFAGGGVQGGAIYGASDRIGAYPSRDPITPGDIAATIFWRFGFDPATEIYDQTGRPYRLATGEPIKSIFGMV